MLRSSCQCTATARACDSEGFNMSKHRKINSRRTLNSVRYLATGVAGAAAASASIMMALPPGAVSTLASPAPTTRAVELTTLGVPLGPVPCNDPFCVLGGLFGHGLSLPTPGGLISALLTPLGPNSTLDSPCGLICQ